jgi:hypothetical protein
LYNTTILKKSYLSRWLVNGAQLKPLRNDNNSTDKTAEEALQQQMQQEEARISSRSSRNNVIDCFSSANSVTEDHNRKSNAINSRANPSEPHTAGIAKIVAEIADDSTAEEQRRNKRRLVLPMGVKLSTSDLDSDSSLERNRQKIAAHKQERESAKPLTRSNALNEVEPASAYSSPRPKTQKDEESEALSLCSEQWAPTPAATRKQAKAKAPLATISSPKQT